MTNDIFVDDVLGRVADHPGVPNVQLVKEKAYIARVYNNQSVAEQNSVDSAWDLLMDVNFRGLRKTICVNEDEQKRFRQLVVNAVMVSLSKHMAVTQMKPRASRF